MPQPLKLPLTFKADNATFSVRSHTLKSHVEINLKGKISCLLITLLKLAESVIYISNLIMHPVISPWPLKFSQEIIIIVG